MKRRFFSLAVNENRVIAYAAVAAGLIWIMKGTIGLP